MVGNIKTIFQITFSLIIIALTLQFSKMMLTTYARRKFRQYASILFFLQLFLWLIYLGFFSANCSVNGNYAIHLQNNNRQNWEQLSRKISVFEREVRKHKRGEEYLAGVKMFENLAAEHRTQIKVLSDEAIMTVE